MSGVTRTLGPESGGASSEKPGRQRGPVEEVIAKRMRQVGKKLQRIKAYSSIEGAKLNADQKAALTTLPALEAVYKELEDLIKEKGPVDEQELIQAAKLREAQEAANASASSGASAIFESYKASLAKNLPPFIRLHSLLHPARPSDHEHLTFGHLTLPHNLQDEVQATDILRVGRMWADLQRDEDSARRVLDLLAGGPDGEDSENDHVHHLLGLLSESQTGQDQLDSSQHSAQIETGNPAAEAYESETRTAPPSITANSAYPPNGYGEMPEETAEAEPVKDNGGAINFLQADELGAGEDGGGDAVDAGTEHSFEVVPMLEPHQTSGMQPPVDYLQHDALPASRTVTPSRFDLTSQVDSQPANWADLDQEDNENQQDGTVAADEEATASNVHVGAQTNHAETPSEEPSKVDSSEHAASSSRRTPDSKQTPRRPNDPKRTKSGGGAQQERQRQAKEPARKTVVDEDGFEMKVRRAPAPVSRGRGRGGSRGGARPEGRGASQGGRSGSGPRPNGSAEGQGNGAGQGMSKNNGQNQRRREQGGGQTGTTGQAQTPKESIFKPAQTASGTA
ncbi:hypothetical protein BD324DRAFT_628984 [Kockovaella imperatae]|uniref:Uncharacterized protein n=1 Tax=Kockovaella imperatae TaxID=4999 RepID=A0A1Y1UEM5_9TREE|nr:hypothetical protein BD324DRAFT_628984 [Kockovaella imperatae]ORX36472.1 hypothetical protein BD324DRAFT_628984 [Kockovaella imperatae]